MNNREDIIRDVARTLFVVAWSDGVEHGELVGEGPGAGGEWFDVAPTEGDPASEKEARRIVDAFDDSAGRPPCAYSEEPGMAPGVHPVELAASIHEDLTGTDRFAHCLAMQALGSGVGLSDDLPVGARLPEWIRASVPRSDFNAWDLDPELYPRQEWTEGARVRVGPPVQGVGSWIPHGGEVVTLLENARPEGWDVFDVLRADGTEESCYGFQLRPLRLGDLP